MSLLPGLPGGPELPRRRVDQILVSARALAHIRTLSDANLRAIEQEWMIREQLMEQYERKIFEQTALAEIRRMTAQ